MKNKTHISILFLMFLVIPISSGLAYGNSSEKVKTEKTLCCDYGDDDNCGKACDNRSCHCPSTVNIPVVFNYFELSNTINFTLLVNEWTYVQYIPKAVYLSFWQPPKIS